MRSLQKLRGRIEAEPEAVANQYSAGITQRLGVEKGDAFQLWMWTQKIQWGNLVGLHRVHSHLSRVLALLLKGRESKGEAYIVQLLQSLRQVSLDGGVWSTSKKAKGASKGME